MDDRERSSGDRRLPVLFIGGFGRSGSTLLARMLAQIPGFVTVGELAQIWERGFTQNVRCGCGRAFRECPFWSATVVDVFGSSGATADEVSQLRRFWMRRSLPLYAVPSLWTARYRADFRRYVERNGEVLRAVRRATGCRVIVDSSKTPLQLVALASLPDVDLHVVHLVRDSRAVAFSWQREHPRAPQRTELDWPPSSPAKTAVLWTATNALLWALRNRGRSYTVLRYEDLVADSATVLSGLAATVGESSTTLKPIDGGIELGMHHTVAGNPMRFGHGPVEIREDSEWRTGMPRTDRRVVSALTSPLLRLYGY